ncbi:Tn3 family transposase [Paenibacillus ottowii]|uniref:Tn3 family transposase n=1 Tax=Paenibacillus ottowii TaxID=2315729 RepID=UPI003F719212
MQDKQLATALLEMGRIEKMIFIMDYLSSEALRRKIHRGVEQGGSHECIGQSAFFGKHGELRERALQDSSNGPVP